MLWSVFLATLKWQVLQNAGREFWDDAIYYTIMTEWLQDIYMTLNSKFIWQYSFVEETIAVTNTNEYVTTYPIMAIIDEKDSDEKNTWVKAGNYFLKPKTFATNETFVASNWTTNTMRQYTMLMDQTSKTWIKWIKTSEAYDTVTIRYLREPTYVDVDTLTSHLDIPNMLSRALRQYCMMELMPWPYLDTGANMSQFYFARYKEALQMYANSIGSNIDFNFVAR